MDTIERWWELLKSHQSEAAWGFFWALVFWAFTDIASIDSRIRGGIRRFKDTLGKASAATLRQRIIARERYRDEVSKYLSSERALYLNTLELVFAVLMCICGGLLCIMMARVQYTGTVHLKLPPMEIPGALFLGMGFYLCSRGIRITSLENTAKVTELLTTLDGEISALKARLASRS